MMRRIDEQVKVRNNRDNLTVESALTDDSVRRVMADSLGRIGIVQFNEVKERFTNDEIYQQAQQLLGDELSVKPLCAL